MSNSTRRSTSSFWKFTDSRILRFCFVFSSLSLPLYGFLLNWKSIKRLKTEREFLSGYASHRELKNQIKFKAQTKLVLSSSRTQFLSRSRSQTNHKEINKIAATTNASLATWSIKIEEVEKDINHTALNPKEGELWRVWSVNSLFRPSVKQQYRAENEAENEKKSENSLIRTGDGICKWFGLRCACSRSAIVSSPRKY